MESLPFSLAVMQKHVRDVQRKLLNVLILALLAVKKLNNTRKYFCNTLERKLLINVFVASNPIIDINFLFISDGRDLYYSRILSHFKKDLPLSKSEIFAKPLLYKQNHLGLLHFHMDGKMLKSKTGIQELFQNSMFNGKKFYILWCPSKIPEAFGEFLPR